MITEKWNDYITDQKQQIFEYRHLNDISYSKNLQKTIHSQLARS